MGRKRGDEEAPEAVVILKLGGSNGEEETHKIPRTEREMQTTKGNERDGRGEIERMNHTPSAKHLSNSFSFCDASRANSHSVFELDERERES